MTLDRVELSAAVAPRPMSLLLQALKQLEANDGASAAAVVEETVSPPAGGMPTLPLELSLDVMRQFGDEEFGSEIAQADPFEPPAMALTVAPQEPAPAAVMKPRRGARQLGAQILSLLPNDSQAVIAVVSLDREKSISPVEEICAGLAALELGAVLAIPAEEDGSVMSRADGAGRGDAARELANWHDAIVHHPDGHYSSLPRRSLPPFQAATRHLLTAWRELSEHFRYIVLELTADDLEPGLFAGLGRSGARCVAEFVRILAVTSCHTPTSYEVGYGPVNNPGEQNLSVFATCDAAFITLRLNETKRDDVEALAARIRSSGCRLCGCLVW